MTAEPDSGPFSVRTADERTQLTTFLDDYREVLRGRLDGLDEEQVRRRLVPSLTTLLGLVKHLTFVETAWFTEAATGTPRTEHGPPDVDGSFTLTADDTIASVLAGHAAACERSRANVAAVGLDDDLGHGRWAPLSLRWAMLQVIREYAQHCGHADILREQILAGRDA